MKLIYWILLMGLLVLSGCSKLSSNSSITSNMVSIDECRNITEDNQDLFGINEKVECLVNYGMEKGTDDCNEEEKQLCEIGQAVKKKNYDYCSSYDYECIIAMGIAVKNPSLCKNIGDDFGEKLCIIGTASSLQDISLCDSVLEGQSYELVELQQQCYLSIASSTKNVNLCTQINEEYQTNCFFDIAVATSNIELCKKTESKESHCYLEIAEKTVNNSLCDMAGNLKQECKKRVLEKNNNLIYENAIKSDNLDECNQIINDSILFKDCHIQIAVNKKDVKICDQFSDSENQECLYALAIPTLNEEFCKYGRGIRPVRDCIRGIAVQKKDSKICDLLEDDLNEGPQCEREVMSVLAQETLDYNDCFILEPFEFGNAYCLMNISLIKSESKGCELIPAYGFGYPRSLCFQELAEQTKNPIYCEEAEDSDECFEKYMTKDSSICNEMSTPGYIRCYLNSICKLKNIKSDCYDTLNRQSRDIIRKATSTNDSSICEELKELKPICYFEFASRLGFTIADVIRYDITGQDEEICMNLDGNLRNKCYFNLAIVHLDEKYCDLSGDFKTRCIQNIWIRNENPKDYQLWEAVKTRLNEERESKKVHFDDMGLPVIRLDFDLDYDIEYAKIINDGDENLDGSSLRLYIDQKLMDSDGCDTIYQKKYVYQSADCNQTTCINQHCMLEYPRYSRSYYQSTVEIEYEGRMINTITPR